MLRFINKNKIMARENTIDIAELPIEDGMIPVLRVLETPRVQKLLEQFNKAHPKFKDEKLSKLLDHTTSAISDLVGHGIIVFEESEEGEQELLPLNQHDLRDKIKTLLFTQTQKPTTKNNDVSDKAETINITATLTKIKNNGELLLSIKGATISLDPTNFPKLKSIKPGNPVEGTWDKKIFTPSDKYKADTTKAAETEEPIEKNYPSIKTKARVEKRINGSRFALDIDGEEKIIVNLNLNEFPGLRLVRSDEYIDGTWSINDKTFIPSDDYRSSEMD